MQKNGLGLSSLLMRKARMGRGFLFVFTHAQSAHESKFPSSIFLNFIFYFYVTFGTHILVPLLIKGALKAISLRRKYIRLSLV